MNARGRRKPLLLGAALVGLVLGGLLGYHTLRLRAQARALKVASARLEAAHKVDPGLVAADNGFGFRLFAELRQAQPKQNLFLSPASVAICLHMVYNGAAGETKAAMAKTLELGDMTTEQLNEANAALRTALAFEGSDLELRTASSLWLDRGASLLPTFVTTNRDCYGARLTQLNLAQPQALETINGWVRDETRGKVRTILDRLEPGTFLVLLNATYFRGVWAHPFDQRKTADAPFHLPDGSSKSVPMMSYDGGCLYRETDRFQAVCLPYRGDRLQMYVFLPREKVGLEGFCSRLGPDRWANWTSRFEKTDGIVRLPRMKLEWQADLNAALKGLGMGIAFDPARADFSAMVAGGSAWIGRARHGTALEVDEEGTEAAAATAVEMAKGEKLPLLTVDRPFFCAIVDSRTQAILFMGAITDPQPAGRA